MRLQFLSVFLCLALGVLAAETIAPKLSVEERVGIQDLAAVKSISELATLKSDDAKGLLAHSGKVSVRRLSDLNFLPEGRTEKLDVYLPPGRFKKNRPAVLFIHGGGFKVGDKAEFRSASVSADLARAGYVVASCNYVLFSKKNPGVWPQNVSDCRNAVRWLRQNAEALGVDPSRIAVAGGSAGGYLALMVGFSDDKVELGGDASAKVSAKVSAVINMYGVTDSAQHGQDTLVSAGPGAAKLFSPITHVRANCPPVLILHGSADPTVPVKESEDLVKALVSVKADFEFIVIKDAVHTFDLHPSGTGWIRISSYKGVTKENSSHSPDIEAATTDFLKRTTSK
ncbi:MAG: alpha/beta hydrolase [bacterium]